MLTFSIMVIFLQIFARECQKVPVGEKPSLPESWFKIQYFKKF